MDEMRLLVAFISGALISLSGSLVQGTTQNELASPSTLGFSALSILVYLVIYYGLLLIPLPIEIEWLSLGCNILLGGCLLLWLKRKSKGEGQISNRLKLDSDYLILLGICFNLFVGAVYSILHFVMLSYNIRFPFELWYGHFKWAGWQEALALASIFILAMRQIFKMKEDLQVMSFGPDLAFNFGVDVHRTNRMAFILAFLCIVSVNSFFGLFSFLGLVFPLILRNHSYFRYRFDREITSGPIISGIMMMLLDFLCYRFLISGAELPVGMLSTVIGTFALVWILLKRSGVY